MLLPTPAVISKKSDHHLAKNRAKADEHARSEHTKINTSNAA
jgi:hypothetical protein